MLSFSSKATPSFHYLTKMMTLCQDAAARIFTINISILGGGYDYPGIHSLAPNQFLKRFTWLVWGSSRLCSLLRPRQTGLCLTLQTNTGLYEEPAGLDWQISLYISGYQSLWTYNPLKWSSVYWSPCYRSEGKSDFPECVIWITVRGLKR